MRSENLKGLFINCVEAHDSIFESGRMVFDCLVNSDKYSLDYIEITRDSVSIPTNYDFYLFNYHVITMSWLDARSIKDTLPGVKMTIVLEVSPNDPFVLCSPDDFDAYIVLDPTLRLNMDNVFAFPRPLQKLPEPVIYEPKEIPVIGSFGFATPGKGFEHVVDAVNMEFERAVVRINIPHATYVDESGAYARQLARMCRERAKDGIDVVVTHNFMSTADLIKWCGQNTLNCFLYDRNQPGLAATTDQAILSGRPLITSKNNTFRHVQSFIKPFPYQSLREAIDKTEQSVKEIQNEWSADKFRGKFENMLDKFDFDVREPGSNTVELTVLPPLPPPPSGFIQEVKQLIAIRTRLRNLRDRSSLRVKPKERHKPLQSYSQFGEDLIINDFFADIPVKVISYLDIGANNPEYINNTFFFYDRGHSGVLVEPNAYLCEKLKNARPRDIVLNVGVGIDAAITEADFFQFPDHADGLSTFSQKEAKHWEQVGMNGVKYNVERTIRMPLLDINRIISENFTECPDFVSIDVEGWDLDILKTMDFDKYSPAVFCVETLAYREDGSTYRIAEINTFFESKGYFSYKETNANAIFVNKKLFDFYEYQKQRRGEKPGS